MTDIEKRKINMPAGLLWRGAGIFILSGISAGVFINFVFPYIAAVPGLGLLTPRFPVEINRTERIRVVESIDIQNAYDKIRDSLVTVLSYPGPQSPFEKGYQTPAMQGGLIVTVDGLIMTPSLARRTGLVVLLPYATPINAEFVSEDPASGIMLIKIPAANLALAQFADARSLGPGDRVLGVGASISAFQKPILPLWLRLKLGAETDYAKVKTSDSTQQHLILDQQLSGEFVGGSVVTGEGRVVGMALPAGIVTGEEMRHLLGKHLSGRNMRRGAWGIRYATLVPALAQSVGGSKGGIILVSAKSQPAVSPGSAAAAAGLREGDILYKINSRELSIDTTFDSMVSDFSPGDTVTVEYLRGGSSGNATLVLK